jgi:hypothetical protein
MQHAACTADKKQDDGAEQSDCLSEIGYDVAHENSNRKQNPTDLFRSHMYQSMDVRPRERERFI